MTRFQVLFAAQFITMLASAQAFLQSPIDGKQGKDYIIVNYVDWKVDGIQDARCGNKTYDGHQGTDYTLKSFKQMDSGVNVLAAADGVVTFTTDGEFDRETAGDISKNLGNYIAIKHVNLYYTYYGHLKKNSIQVNVGNFVKAGEVIGQVGSSGNSTDAHLHFEVWYDSAFLVDPFSGSCGNPTSLFIDEPAYDTSLHVWDYGIDSKSGLSINDLRERNSSLNCCPFEIAPNNDEDLNFWAHLSGVRKGKKLETKWYTPQNVLWFNYPITLTQDYWYYFYWTYINHQNLAMGGWKVELEYDGDVIISQTFDVKAQTTSVFKPNTNASLCDNYVATSAELLKMIKNENTTIYDITGKEIKQNQAANTILQTGVYICVEQLGTTTCHSKVYCY